MCKKFTHPKPVLESKSSKGASIRTRSSASRASKAHKYKYKFKGASIRTRHRRHQKHTGRASHLALDPGLRVAIDHNNATVSECTTVLLYTLALGNRSQQCSTRFSVRMYNSAVVHLFACTMKWSNCRSTEVYTKCCRCRVCTVSAGASRCMVGV